MHSGAPQETELTIRSMVVGLALAALVSGCGSSNSGQTANLLRASADSGDPADGTGPEYLRYRFVDVDTSGLLSALQVTLALFDDTTCTATRTTVAQDTDGSYVWEGTVLGHNGSQVLLSVDGEALTGFVQIGSRRFEIEETEGPHIVTEANPDFVSNPGPKTSLPPSGRAPATPPAWRQAAADDGSVVDLMVLYTPAARLARDGQGDTTNGIKATIDALVAQVNDALTKSGAAFRVRRVHSQEFVYDETRLDMSTVLDAIRTDAGVAAARDRYAADIVMLLVGKSDGTDQSNDGIACWLPNPLQPDATLGYAVSSLRNIFVELTFVHEVGHLFGLDDTKAEGPAMGAGDAYPDRYDMRTTAFCGPMCYWQKGLGYMMPYFSNPAITVPLEDGGTAPGGITGQRNSVRCLNAAAPGLANYRRSATATAQPD